MNTKVMGIDVGKRELHYSDITGNVQGKVANDGRGFKKIRRIISENSIELAVLEATGGYEQKVLLDLAGNRIKVAIVEPTRVRNHARAAGQLAKTDRIDAKVIAHFGFCHQPRPFVLQSESKRQLRQLGKRRRQLIGNRVQEKCRLEKSSDGFSTGSINRMIGFFDEELERIDALMDALIESDRELLHRSGLLESCPSIGRGTARVILAECPELGSMNRKQIASLAGLAPMNRDSGDYQGSRYIQRGRKHLRNALYMVVVSGQRHNVYLKERYERLRETKPGKVAIVACMRKLLTQLNAMIRDDTCWSLDKAQGDMAANAVI